MYDAMQTELTDQGIPGFVIRNGFRPAWADITAEGKQLMENMNG